MLPISVTKCDLLTKVFNQDRNSGLGRRSKTTSPLVKNVEKSAQKYSYSENSKVGKRGSDEEKVGKKAQCEKRLSQPPVAEFVDIDEKIRKIREKVLRGNAIRQTMRSRSRNECCTDDNPKPGTNETTVTQEETGKEGEKTKMEYGERLGTGDQNNVEGHEEGGQGDLKSSSKCARNSGKCAQYLC